MAPTGHLTLSLPKNGRVGEDADPVCIVDELADIWLGVFDGMGGAGATSYSIDGESLSGAFIGSRVAAGAFETWARSEAANVPPGERAGSLHDFIEDRLKAEHKRLGDSPSRIRSRLLKALPTTVAVVGVYARPAGGHGVDALWAGDSRIYLLFPGDGLTQVTSDHLESNSDAQGNLSDDSPMSNCASADIPFYIEEVLLDVHTPFLVMAATDGCFGYVESPILYEELLLDALAQSDSMTELKAALIDRIGFITADDASLGLVAVGWDHFADINAAFAGRREWIKSASSRLHHARYMVNSARSVLEAEEVSYRAVLGALWAEYRPLYQQNWQSNRSSI